MANIPVKMRGIKASKRAIVDDEDFESAEAFRWFEDAYGYAVASIGGKMRKMHRVLTAAPKDKQVDHINGNRLDNRRENLRLCDCSGNARNMTKLRKDNTSGFMGVYWGKRAKKWLAQINLEGKRKGLGSFNSKEDAYEVYKLASLEHFGEFSPFNSSILTK